MKRFVSRHASSGKGQGKGQGSCQSEGSSEKPRQLLETEVELAELQPVARALSFTGGLGGFADLDAGMYGSGGGIPLAAALLISLLVMEAP